MSAVWLFLVSLTVFGALIYNFAVKLAGEIINPFVFTVILTVVALVGHLAAFGINRAFFNPDLKFIFGTSGFVYAALAGIGVVIIDLAYFYAVKEGGLVLSNTFWNVGSLAVVAIVGVLFFNESIGAMKAVGIGLGIISVVLITRA